MKKTWYEGGWKHYLYWYEHDPQIVKKIHRLLQDMERTPFSGLGKPEPLKGKYSGCWSRRITDEHRLIYRVRDDVLEILACMGHYDD